MFLHFWKEERIWLDEMLWIIWWSDETGLNSQQNILLTFLYCTCHSSVMIPVLSPCDCLWQQFALLLSPSSYHSDCDCAKLSSPAKISMGINGNSVGCQLNRLTGLVPKMFEFHYPRQYFLRQPANVMGAWEHG